MTESTVASTPLDTLRQRLNEAPSPLLLKDAIKGLTPKGKNAPPPPDFTALLSEEVQEGRVFRYPSGKDDADRYWGRDEKQAIREAVLNAATEPKKLNDLKKLAKDTVKADKKFSDAIVDELVSTEQLYKQSSAGSAPYGKEKPRSLDKAAVSAAIIAAAETPQNSANLVKAAKQATGADKEFAESILKELIDGKQLHPQSAATNPLYGKEKSRSLDKAAVSAAILTAAETPQNSANLVKAAKQATGADKDFAESILKELIDGSLLHPQSAATNPLYGKNEPPHPLDVDPGKKAFAALVKTGQKLVEVAPSVALDEVFQRLRIALEHRPPTPHVEQTAMTVPSVVSHPSEHSPPTPTEAISPVTSPPSETEPLG
ncbi:MAG TPA: hypothetical protein VG122_24810 [Gemmata sp.]|nr:hypothetical protein [Gemmata sp.]